MTDLDKLIEAVEGDVATHDLPAPLDVTLGRFWTTICNAYNGSLDAAKALHEALLPDYLWAMTPLGKASVLDKSFNVIAESGYVGGESRAWLIAILKAHRSHSQSQCAK